MKINSSRVSRRAVTLSIEQAIERIRQGGVVAIPTETVYCLAADASKLNAVERIFSIKGRPIDHPLIVHIGSVAQVHNWAYDIPNILWPLARQFWPGPLTMILKKKPQVSALITGGQNTIALRIPAQQKTLQLLVSLKCGLAAPSANRFGRVSPTQAQHVIEELGSEIDGIVDGGTCEVGIESTILDLSSEQPMILRPGQISHQEIEDCLGRSLLHVKQPSPRVPGVLKSHYAPTTPLFFVEKSALDEQLSKCLKHGLKVNIWSASRPALQNKVILWKSSSVASKAFAKTLYHQLRQFDRTSADITLIELLPELPEWHAIHDRLTRAAQHSSLDSYLSRLSEPT